MVAGMARRRRLLGRVLLGALLVVIVAAAAGYWYARPLLLTGILSALQKGPSHMVTFIVLFSASQTFGGLVGSSFFSSYQQMRTQHYQAEIINDLPLASPQVQQRLLSDGQSSHAYTPDPALEQNQALRALHQRVTEEAQVRAYSDVIFLNKLFALLLLFWGLFIIAASQYRSYKQRLRPDSS